MTDTLNVVAVDYYGDTFTSSNDGVSWTAGQAISNFYPNNSPVVAIGNYLLQTPPGGLNSPLARWDIATQTNTPPTTNVSSLYPGGGEVLSAPGRPRAVYRRAGGGRRFGTGGGLYVLASSDAGTAGGWLWHPSRFRRRSRMGFSARRSVPTVGCMCTRRRRPAVR